MTGRSVGPDGKPAAGVPVDIIGGSSRAGGRYRCRREGHACCSAGAAGADGHFHIEASRAASSSRFSDIYALGRRLRLRVELRQREAPSRCRAARGGDSPPARPGQSRGTLVDVNGQPAAGVDVCVKAGFTTPPPQPTAADLTAQDPDVATCGRSTRGDRCVAQGRDERRPRPVRLGRHRPRTLCLPVHQRPHFAQQRLGFDAGDRDATKNLSPLALIRQSLSKAGAGRRHRPADRQCRDLSTGQLRQFWREWSRQGFAPTARAHLKSIRTQATIFACVPFPARASLYLPQEAEARPGPRTAQSKKRST